MSERSQLIRHRVPAVPFLSSRLASGRSRFRLAGARGCYGEAEGIRQMLDVEPSGDSVAAGHAPVVCDDCLLGLSADPDAWFRERMRMHAAKKPAKPE